MSRARSAALALFAVTAAGVAAGPSPAGAADPPPQPGGQLQVLAIAGKPPAEATEFPLKHTDVKVEIAGFVARVEVRQTYLNPYPDRIEAVYTFPLPDDAAVDQMEMQIGKRVIHGDIKRRDEAKKIYDAARDRGQTAALLDQERPNIFTQQVANIQPGERVDVVIRYVAILKYDAGEYELNFPTVVGPRYIPGEQLPDPPKGAGWSADTHRVPDASRITPPVLEPGERSGHDISLAVRLDAGMQIQDLRSPSHEIDVPLRQGAVAQVVLRPADSIPNKDFILRYKVAGKLPEAALLTHHDAKDEHGYFTLMIQPQAAFTPAEVTPKEMIFVIDTSGSMSGEPMEKAKELMRRAIKRMNPGDSFQILDFEETVSQMSPRPLANTAQNRERALAYVDTFSGSGGTNMLSAIEACLDLPRDRSRMRVVVFITDGYIGNENEILRRIQTHLGDARLFVFGVGSSVNHYLLDRMAIEGRGFKQYVRPDESTAPVVGKFYDRIANPLLTDVTIDWNGLDARDVYPAKIPDLFSAQPVYVHGRYSRPGQATVVVRGRIAGKPFEQDIQVTFPAVAAEHGALASIWARQRIEDLERKQYGGEDTKIAGEITEVALQHHLMSRYTSFVAVEETTVADPNGGPPRKVVQPVELPEGVEYEGVFGDEKSAATGSGAGMNAPAATAPRQGYRSHSPAPSAPPPPVMPSPVPHGNYAGGGDAEDAPMSEPRSAEPEEPSKPAEPSYQVEIEGGDGPVKGAVRAAIARTLRDLSGASGTWVLEVVVKGGHVTEIRVVRDSVGNAGLLRRVRDGLKRARLAGSGAETTLRVTIRM